MHIVSLKNQKEFNYVNKIGTKLHGSFFIIIVSSSLPRSVSSENSTLAFGMKVSRKFSKKANIRNKSKRRIRHLVRLLTKEPMVNVENRSIIIIPKMGFDKSDFADLYLNFKKMFQKSI